MFSNSSNIHSVNNSDTNTNNNSYNYNYNHNDNNYNDKAYESLTGPTNPFRRGPVAHPNIYIYIYIYIYNPVYFGRGDDMVGNPHRAQIIKFELFELILLLIVDKQFPVEQFEATVSQSTVPSPLLILCYYCSTANPRTNIMDFRGFDSRTMLISRGGIPRPIGNFPESLSQAILVGIMLVGRLGVLVSGMARSRAHANIPSFFIRCRS